MSDPEREPNSEQWQAIAFGNGPLRIVAGAGTGKTFTLARRIAALVEAGKARPSEILALTFTNKAAAELKERVATTLAERSLNDGDIVDIDTYHAFGGRILAEFGHLVGLPPEPTLLSAAEGWILLWHSLDEIDYRHIDLTFIRGGPQGSPLRTAITLGSRMRDELVTFDAMRAYLEAGPADEARDITADHVRALEVYERKKRSLGAIDFGDQIGLACELLSREEVAQAYQRRYRYILVDEFQDTNYAQSVMVQRLVGRTEGNICVVGDPNQAIYSFRGASPDNLDRFAESEFPGTTTIPLRRNFRSTQAILDVANAIWTDLPGDFRGNLVSAVDERGVRPEIVECTLFADELAYIAGEIERLFRAGYDYKHIAVITRVNRLKSSIYRGLRDRQIPVEAVGGSSLYETPEVREIISLLRVLVDPTDDPSFMHVLCAPWWALDEAAVYELARHRQRSESLQDCCRRLVALDQADQRVARCLDTLESLTERTYRVELSTLIDEIVRLRNGGYDPLEQANIYRLVAVLQSIADNRIERVELTDLTAYIDLLLDAGADDEAAGDIDLGDADTVKVLTAHAAKGLEWPVVFVAGANRQDFSTQNRNRDPLPIELAHAVPDRPSRAQFSGDEAGGNAYERVLKEWRSAQHKLEELRVLYVALTRAQERLYITWSHEMPPRRTNYPMLPALQPAAPYCTQHAAPPAAESAVTSTTFRQVITPVGDAIQSMLDEDLTRLEPALESAWRQAGGVPGVGASAARRFVAERSNVIEHIEAIRAIEAREDVPPAEIERSTELTYTKISTFEICPHRYYLQYVAGSPLPPRRKAATFGTAFHNAIAAEARRRAAGESVNDDAVRTLFLSEIQIESKESHEQWNGSEFAGSFDPLSTYLISPDFSAQPLLVEEPFVLRLPGIAISGVIDRVHRLPDGTIEVVDYKTGAWLPSEKDARANLQLPIYLLALRELFPELVPTPQTTKLFFVSLNVVWTFTYSDEELHAVRDRLADLTMRMRRVTPTEHLASESNCTSCDFRRLCAHQTARPPA